ncbi:Blue-light-activated protein [compost metagenome]
MIEELKKAEPDWRVVEAASRGAVDNDPDSVRFSVDAAHIQRLGEQLVSKQETALSELIKNAFDADATHVTLEFSGQAKAGGALTIVDDGSGMTEDVIRSSWMRISTNNKEQEPKSPLYKRVRAGRKGIGRFAVQRLGKHLRFTTRPVGETTGFQVSFHWDEAFRPGVSLADVFSRIERFPKASDDHGTQLEILHLRDAWSPSAIERVWKSIVLLQAPFPIATRTPGLGSSSDPGFQVVINDKTHEAQSELFSIQKSFLDHALAEITAEIDEHGKARVRLRSSKLDIDEVAESDRSFSLTGPVALESRYFIYLSPLLSGISQSAASAMGTEFGGIRIYRNGFRVQPYGQASDDWLDLAFDSARRNLLAPANNFNFFGHVSISSETNPLFEETSSREGLIENEAFEELKAFTRWALEWASLRVAAYRKRKQRAGERGFTSQRVKPSEMVQELIERHGGSSDGPEADPGLGVDFKRLAAVVTDYEETVEAERRASIEYEEMLRILASLGLSISVFGHEIKGAERALVANILLLGDLIEEVADSDLKGMMQGQNEELEISSGRLFDIGGYIAGLMSRTESRELRDLSVKGAIDRFTRQFSGYMAKQHVSFEVDVEPAELRTAPMHAAELDSVLLNFLTNSIKSMKKAKVADRRVRIQARRVGRHVEIAFEDNGVGIPVETRDRIFDAFFTTTMSADDDGIAGPGTGLGLKIVSDIAESYGGEVAVGEPGDTYTCRMEFSVLAIKNAES